MDKFKFFRKDNYIVLINNLTQVTQYGFVKEVMVDKSNVNKASYRVFGIKDFNDKNSLAIDQLLKEDGSAYTVAEFETFYTQNTGNFNGGGTAPVVINSDDVENVSNVVGATTSDALNTLDTDKEDLSNKQNSLILDGTGKKYATIDAINSAKPFFCAVRNIAGTWTLIIDAIHFYSDNIISVANATLTNAVINIQPVVKVGTVVATTDETYARYGLFVGCTVSTTTIGIDVYKKGLDGYISYDGANWVYNPGQGVLISASDITFSYDTVNGILTVTHTIASGDTSEYGISVQKRSSMTAIDTYVGVVTLTSFQVYFKDATTQAAITTPNTNMKFFFNRDMIWKVPNSILGLTYSNIWLSGTFKY